MPKTEDPRELSAYEIVDAMEELMDYIEDGEYHYEDRERLFGEVQQVIDKLVGPERQSESRFSTRHILVDEPYCELLADSLGISVEEAHDCFIGEPVKYAEVIAAWALDQVDNRSLGEDRHGEPDPDSNGPMVHLQRGRACADILAAWAENNQRGVYRRRQDHRVGTQMEESA